MPELQLGGKVVATQTANNEPVLASNVNLSSADMSNANIKTSFSSLDNSASQGPTTDLTNTTLPIFACRAWVNFDGTDYTTVGSENHCTIRASGNVSKVVRSSRSNYVIYFTTPIIDDNYCWNGSAGFSASIAQQVWVSSPTSANLENWKTAYFLYIKTVYANNTENTDAGDVNVTIFR